MTFNNLTDKEIIDIVMPLAKHTEDSWNKKDYWLFCHYLLEDPEHKFTEECFNGQIEKNYDKYGKHTIKYLVTLHRNPDNVIVGLLLL